MCEIIFAQNDLTLLLVGQIARSPVSWAPIHLSYFHFNKVCPAVVALLGGWTGSLALTDRTSLIPAGGVHFHVIILLRWEIL